jgi:microsomal epoxide hydrolase
MKELAIAAVFFVAPMSAAWKDGFVRTSDGVRIHYIEAGSGPAIVFEPGWTMPAEIWEPQIDGLSKNFRVVAIDPRSQGKSDRVAEGHYPSRRAQDIKEVVDQLELAPATLVGWSLGVAEVLAYVDQFGTSTLRGVVLVDGFIGAEPDIKFVQGFAAMLKSVQTNRAVWNEKFVRSMYRKPQTEAYLQKITAASMSVPTNTAVALIANLAMGGWDARRALAKIDKPVLYAITPGLKSQGDMLKQTLPSARVELFDGAGHALFVDDAARFNALLAEFAAAR